MAEPVRQFPPNGPDSGEAVEILRRLEPVVRAQGEALRQQGEALRQQGQAIVKLGERMDHVQADVAGLKSEMVAVKTEVVSLKSGFHSLEVQMGRVEGRVMNLPTYWQMLTAIVTVIGAAFALMSLRH